MSIDAHIQISDISEFTNLLEWLRSERTFAGRVSTVSAPPGPNDLGAVSDVLVVALGSGGAGAALAGSLTAWLRSRRSDVKIKVTASGTVEVDARRVDSATIQPMLEAVLLQARQ